MFDQRHASCVILPAASKHGELLPTAGTTGDLPFTPFLAAPHNNYRIAHLAMCLASSEAVKIWPFTARFDSLSQVTMLWDPCWKWHEISIYKKWGGAYLDTICEFVHRSVYPIFTQPRFIHLGHTCSWKCHLFQMIHTFCMCSAIFFFFFFGNSKQHPVSFRSGAYVGINYRFNDIFCGWEMLREVFGWKMMETETFEIRWLFTSGLLAHGNCTWVYFLPKGDNCWFLIYLLLSWNIQPYFQTDN